MGDMTCEWVLIAQWIERPPGVREAMGSIPAGDSDLFFVMSCCSNHLSHFITELKIRHFYSLINILRVDTVVVYEVIRVHCSMH